MKKCKTCRYFGEIVKEENDDYLKFHRCNSISERYDVRTGFLENLDSRDVARSACTSARKFEISALEVTEDFGCTLHEEKAEGSD